MPCVCPHSNANGFNYLFASRSLTQKLDMFFPWQRHKHSHTDSSTTVEIPTWRRVINPHQIQTSLPHQRKIGIKLLRPPEVVAISVRLERTVSHAFHEEFFVAFEEEFCSGTNPRVYDGCH